MSRRLAALLQRDTGQRASGFRSPGTPRSRVAWHAPPRRELALTWREFFRGLGFFAFLVALVVAAVAAIVSFCAWVVTW